MAGGNRLKYEVSGVRRQWRQLRTEQFGVGERHDGTAGPGRPPGGRMARRRCQANILVPYYRSMDEPLGRAGGVMTATTKVGISVHDSLMVADPGQRRRLLELVSDAGIDYASVGDHISFHGGTGFDGLVAATSVLSTHDTLPVVVGIYLLGLRHPMLAARQLASISQIAPGRVDWRLRSID